MSSFLSDPLILHHPLLKQASLILVDMIAVDYYSLSHVEQKDYIHSFINAIILLRLHFINKFMFVSQKS